MKAILTLAALGLACESWNTPAVRTWREQMVAPTDGSYGPEFTVRVGDDDTPPQCPAEKVEATQYAADRWCSHTEGRFCPVISVSDEKGQANVTCSDGLDNGLHGIAFKIGSIKCVPDSVDERDLWAIVAHEMGHFCHWYCKDVVLVDVNSHGHTPSGVTAVGSRFSRDMPGVILE